MVTNDRTSAMGLNSGSRGLYLGSVGLNDGDWGPYLGDVGPNNGD